MSRSAAACAEVTMPMRDGSVGIGFLALGGEQAFGFELGFELLERQLQRAGAFGFDVFGRNLQVSPRSS